MMERRPRVWRKEKFAESGKPDRNMPLSTMAKFSGGIKLRSSETAGDGTSVCGERSQLSITATSIVLYISPASPLVAAAAVVEFCSTFMTNDFFSFKERKVCVREIGNHEECSFFFNFLTVKRNGKKYKRDHSFLKLVALVVI